MSKRGSVLRVNTKSDKVKKMGKREYPYHGCVIKKGNTRTSPERSPVPQLAAPCERA